MPCLDQELSRLRVDKGMKKAIIRAARAQGITIAAWRKIAYGKALTEQLGGWRGSDDDDQGEDAHE